MKYLMVVVLTIGTSSLLYGSKTATSRHEKQQVLYNAVTKHYKKEEVEKTIRKRNEVKSIIYNGIDLNYRYYNEETILHIAINSGCDLETIRLLITDDNINVSNESGETALYLAIKLVEEGLVGHKNLAIDRGLAIINLLLQNGASKNDRTPDQTTTLFEYVHEMLLSNNTNQTLCEMFDMFNRASDIRSEYLELKFQEIEARLRKNS